MARISQPQLEDFAISVLRRSGLADEDAQATAGGLVEATIRGVSSHGVFRLPQYSESLRSGAINSRPNVAVIHQRRATVLVDADGGYGYRPSLTAMEIAIGLAREHGVGLAGVRNSHHFGAAAIYTLRAASQQMIGLATTTTSPRIAPTGGVSAVIGNNPISIAVPRRPPLPPIVLDMALGQVALGKIRIAAAAGRAVPEGWGYDSAGQPTTNARDILNGGLLAPIGGYKGYGLALIVELLAGPLTGSRFGLDANNHRHRNGGVGHFLLAIDWTFLGAIETFYDDVERLIQQVKSAGLADGSSGIYLPGELEQLESDRARTEGIEITEDLAGQLTRLAEDLGIAPPSWRPG